LVTYFYPFARILDGFLPFGVGPRQHHPILVSLLHPEGSTLSSHDVLIGQDATDLEYRKIKLFLESPPAHHGHESVRKSAEIIIDPGPSTVQFFICRQLCLAQNAIPRFLVGSHEWQDLVNL
jgi:hypothetical protein